jgi:hypothetical protein
MPSLDSVSEVVTFNPISDPFSAGLWSHSLFPSPGYQIVTRLKSQLIEGREFVFMFVPQQFGSASARDLISHDGGVYQLRGIHAR